MSAKAKAAILGSGNIGTDLMIKILRHSETLEMAAMVGIDAASDGLACAASLGVRTTHDGIDLDIMTSAALATGESIARRAGAEVAA